jgi:hypothetical protein
MRGDQNTSAPLSATSPSLRFDSNLKPRILNRQWGKSAKFQKWIGDREKEIIHLRASLCDLRASAFRLKPQVCFASLRDLCAFAVNS